MKSQLSSPMPNTASGARLGEVTAAPGPFASFVRFVVCGGGVGVLAGLAVPLVAVVMPWAVANAVITVVSTLLCTELHALFTFGTGKRPGWRQHFQSAGSATAAYVVTCAAVFILHAVQPQPGMLVEQVVYLSAAGLAGIGRFLVLRLFVFAAGRNTAKGRAADVPLERAVDVPLERAVDVTLDWAKPVRPAYAGAA